jgi:VWFA-related protein
MLESSRARVFVLFLDVFHVGLGGSYTIRKPLVDALDRVISADDLVGVMTPDMSPSDIAFARKTTTIDGMLRRYWYWGERDRLVPPDPKDRRYEECYPPLAYPGIAKRMIERRHEKMTMDALDDLVQYVRGIREERKAVLAITEGWLLFRPDPTLARPLDGSVPTGPQIGIDPRGGKLTVGTPKDLQNANDTADCETDRLFLSMIDDDQAFRVVQDDANRSNTSFYPIDPRGLAVFDTPIGPDPPPPLQVDAAMLRARQMSLRTLADATDGLAIVNTNDIARGLKRVVDDLTSYYLLGYYTTAKLDGKFHSISVRVKRPGVSVRARRGYLAASEADVNAAARGAARANAAAGAPSPAAAAEARAIDTALAGLEGYARPLPVRLHAAAGWKPGNAAGIWVVGEVGTGPEWRGGAQAELTLMNGAGTTVATGRATVDAGARSFRATLTPDEPLSAGDYTIRLRLRGADATASSANTLRIALPEGPDATGAIFVRRGPPNGARDVPTSDLRFRRSEQLRVELPAPGSAPISARLLDRTGKALGVPVTTTVRDDPDGSRWQVAQVALAPLAPADYLIEISSEGKRTLLGFRVIQ